MAKEKTLIAKIAKKYGDVIDLKKNPEVMIEILRTFPLYNDGGLPGGVPPSPPPGPTSFQDRVSNEDLMKAVLQLSRQVKALTKPAAAAPRSKATPAPERAARKPAAKPRGRAK
jgi:hypothetical protein